MASPSVPHPCNSSSSAAGSPPRRSVASASPSPPAWPSEPRLARRRPEPQDVAVRPAPRPRHDRSGQRRPAAGGLLRRPAEVVRRPRHRSRHPLGLGVGPRLRDGGLGRLPPAGAGRRGLLGRLRIDHTLDIERHRHQRPGGRCRRARHGQDRRTPAGASARRPHPGRLRRHRPRAGPARIARSHGHRRPGAAVVRRAGRGDRPRRRLLRGTDRPRHPRAVVDVADPASPTVVQETAYDSSLVTARLHGDVIPWSSRSACRAWTSSSRGSSAPRSRR